MLAVNWKRWRQGLMSIPIIRAFLISVGLHLVAFLIIEMGNHAGLWKASVLPKSALNPASKTVDPKNPPINRDPPLLQFVEVDPAQAAEEPKETPLYSNANTAAANPDPRLNIDKPKIEGTQDKILKTFDTAKAQPVPPPPPPPQQKREAMQPATQQVSNEPIGDTKQNTLTPEEKAKQDLTFDQSAQKQTQAQTPRPRTLADARAQKGIIEAPKAKQEGGVKRFALESTMDVKNSPFGSYDAAFIAAVQARWYALLDIRQPTQSGKVVVDFRLYNDGRILQLNITESEVTQTMASLCQQAILDPSPYARFPADLKRILGKDYRDIRFTFHYGY